MSEPMPAPSPASAQLGILTERIEAQSATLCEVRADIKAIGEAVTNLATEYRVEHARVVDRTHAAHQRIDGVERRLDALTSATDEMRKTIQPLIATSKVIMWLGGVVGVTLVAFLWSIMTGQVTVLFP